MLVNPAGTGFEGFWRANCDAPLTERLPYAIRQLSDGRVVGMSAYFMALARHNGVEIGATFLRPDVRAGAVNRGGKRDPRC
jgi:N-acetyltransferase